MVIPSITFLALLTASDILQSMNYILKYENYYNLTPAEANQVSADSFTYGQLASVPVVILAGFMYDMMGRTFTTVATIMLGAISTVLTPLVAPSIAGYDICRSVFVCHMAIILSNPFVNDYVQV